MDGTAQEDKTAARGASPDGGSGPLLPFNISHWLFIFDGLSEYAETWWSESDFQMKLFLFLLSWLFINVCLIWFCWRKYGDKLSQMLMKGTVFAISKNRSHKIFEAGLKFTNALTSLVNVSLAHSRTFSGASFSVCCPKL